MAKKTQKPSQARTSSAKNQKPRIQKLESPEAVRRFSPEANLTNGKFVVAIPLGLCKANGVQTRSAVQVDPPEATLSPNFLYVCGSLDGLHFRQKRRTKEGKRSKHQDTYYEELFPLRKNETLTDRFRQVIEEYLL